MAVTVMQSQPSKLRTIKLKKDVLIAGQAAYKGKTVRVAEVDAFTLVAGEQAELIDDDAADTKADGKDA